MRPSRWRWVTNQTIPTLTYQRHPLWDFIEDGRPYEPFPWQVEHIHSREEQFLLIAAGRRAGKSTAMKAEIVQDAIRKPDVVMGLEHAPIVYVVGPTAELANRVFEPIWSMFVPDERGFYQPPLGEFYHTHDKNRGLIVLRNGARIYKKTGDDPRSLQGERVTLAIVDEAHEMNEEAWKALVPSLIDSNGRLLCIGIPWGRGRFMTMHTLGLHHEPGYYAASVPTTANPHITDEMLRQLTAALTEAEIESYIYAKPTSNYGEVFREPERIFKARPPQEYRGPFLMGLDVAKMVDFTVAYVIDIPTMHVVARDRFNKLDYVSASSRVAGLYREWHCQGIHTDTTGVGETMADLLINEHLAVLPFKFNISSKQALVSTLIRAVEQEMVWAMPDDHALLAEMKVFEGKLVQSASGQRVEYEAAPGAHDDCVMALALAVAAALPAHIMSDKPINAGSYANFGRKPRRREQAVA